MIDVYVIMFAILAIILISAYIVCYSKLKEENKIFKNEIESLTKELTLIKSKNPDLDLATDIMDDFKHKGYTFLRIDPDSVLLRK